MAIYRKPLLSATFLVLGNLGALILIRHLQVHIFHDKNFYVTPTVKCGRLQMRIMPQRYAPLSKFCGYAEINCVMTFV